MIRSMLIVVSAFLLLVSAAWALDLPSAKQSGFVGETPSVYLVLVQANPAAAELVKSINAKRKQEYADIAKRNGIDLKAVEQLAGKKAIDKTPAGQFVQINGTWVKK